MKRLRFVLMFAAFLGLSQVSLADPIIYNPDLTADCTLYQGSISQDNEEYANPVGAEYFRFWGEQGKVYCVTGHRLDDPYDMSFWVFEGQFADTTDFDGGFAGGFDASDPGWIDFADNEIPHPGPFSDPFSMFTATTTGWHSIIVTNFDSEGVPPYGFTLEICECPEPSTFLLVLSAGLGLAVRRRKVS